MKMESLKMRVLSVVGAILLCCCGGLAAHAQQDFLPASVSGLLDGLVPGLGGTQSPARPEIQSSFVPAPDTGDDSILFTYWEQQAIQRALAARGIAVTDISPGTPGGPGGRGPFAFPPTPGGIQLPGDVGPDGPEALPPPGERELRLSSLVYVDNKNWAVWLNETEIRPGQIPENAAHMEVTQHYVDIEWHDPYTNQIFPVRLRPNQRFNLDMRVFLPGSEPGGAPVPPPPPPEPTASEQIADDFGDMFGGGMF
jgi:hypothetical protein